MKIDDLTSFFHAKPDGELIDRFAYFICIQQTAHQSIRLAQDIENIVPAQRLLHQNSSRRIRAIRINYRIQIGQSSSGQETLESVRGASYFLPADDSRTFTKGRTLPAPRLQIPLFRPHSVSDTTGISSDRSTSAELRSYAQQKTARFQECRWYPFRFFASVDSISCLS